MLLNTCIILGFLVWIAYLCADLYLKRRGRATPSTPSAPSVVVNVPADFKMPEALPPTQIEGARAALFYAVYSKAIEGFTENDNYLSTDDEAEALMSAQAAVDKVFGS